MLCYFFPQQDQNRQQQFIDLFEAQLDDFEAFKQN